MADDWQLAGQAWSERAPDFAYLYEPCGRPTYQTTFDRLGLTAGATLLDVACGAGYAAMMAAERGATVAGIDAAERLIDIARARVPAGDFRVTDMRVLPFASETFDFVSSFSGIGPGWEQAMAEAVRVLRPGGLFGLTGWSSPRRRQHLAYFMPLVDISPPEDIRAAMVLMSAGRPGVIEKLLTDAGLEVIERGLVDMVSEWPDVPTALQALRAPGPSWAAIEHVGVSKFDKVMTAALTDVLDPLLGIRLTSEFFWITARKPG
jgi:ubiquinone/menaquinone biosynthesis C-methylase UbiE